MRAAAQASVAGVQDACFGSSVGHNLRLAEIPSTSYQWAVSARRWNVWDSSVLRRRCTHTAAGAGQDDALPIAPVDLAGPPATTLPKHFGDIRDRHPVNCLICARQTPASTLTVPDEPSTRQEPLRTNSTRGQSVKPSLTRSTRCSRIRGRLGSCASRSRPSRWTSRAWLPFLMDNFIRSKDRISTACSSVEPAANIRYRRQIAKKRSGRTARCANANSSSRWSACQYRWDPEIGQCGIGRIPLSITHCT